MPFFPLWLTAGIIILVLMTLLWLLSLYLKNSSIVDIFWGTGFFLSYWMVAWFAGESLSMRAMLLGAFGTIWGLRLSVYIFLRNHAQPEDFRYAAWRSEAGSAWWWRSFFKVFLLQGAIMWIVAAPLFVTQAEKAAPLNLLDLVGALVWLIGFVFEAGGDWQLSRFKANSTNKSKLLTSGLWSLTRHPNYFGDAAQWWGFYIISLSSGGWWTIFSPIIMTFLLMKVSGVAMLERTLTKTKPGYEEYIARTSEFFPWLLKKS